MKKCYFLRQFQMTFPIYMYIGNEDVHVLIYLLFGLLIMSQLDVEYCVLNHFVNVHVRLSMIIYEYGYYLVYNNIYTKKLFWWLPLWISITLLGSNSYALCEYIYNVFAYLISTRIALLIQNLILAHLANRSIWGIVISLHPLSVSFLTF
jgi:hypothetical protein